MNSSLKRLMAACIVAICLVSIYSNSRAGNYTWTGATSSSWNTSSNWSPAAVPGTNDTVNISDGSGSQTIQLTSNTSINRLVISGRTIDLNTRELTISARASFNGGTINNGSLKLRGTYVYFQGTNTNCTIDCIAGQIKFSGGTFDGTGTFEHNGTANGWGEGGCTFNAAVTIKKSGSSTLRLGQTNPDYFNSTVEFICTSSGPIEVSQGSQSVFSNAVYLNCTHSSGSISFCSQTPTATLAEESRLLTGTTGINAGRITIKGLEQDNDLTNALSGTGSALISLDSCIFNGEMNLTSPTILLKNNTFQSACTFTKTSASSNSYNYGNNIFNGAVTIENQDASRAFRFANDAGDTFNSEVSFTTGSNNIQVAYKGNNYFGGNITINSNKVVFNANTGKVIFNGSNAQVVGGSAAYAIAKLEINKSSGSIQLNRSMTIDSALTFVSGIINTDSVITLKAASNCSGASNQSFVDGPVKKIGNTAFVFPVGDEGQWNPIGISAPTNVSDAFVAQYFLNPQTYGNNIDSAIFRISSCNHWTLSRVSGTTKVFITLHWDSLRCTLYDTTGLCIASWNGTIWESLGANGLTGSVLDGDISSFSLSNNYFAFTLGEKNLSTNLILISSSPTLNINAGLGTWNHSISEDYFGYNGANVLDAGQYYSDLRSNPNNGGSPVLLHNGISTIRLNGGTFGNYWDWRTSWFIQEGNLPNNWFYTHGAFQQPIPARVTNGTYVNDMSYFKVSNDIVGSRPIFQLNSLTSTFNYEVASLFKAEELNLPVKYVELGNEFYLNDEQYKDVYPSSVDYINYANDFTKKLKDLSIFGNVKVAVIGASTPNGIPGRRMMWLDAILANINKYPTSRPDAITIHEYYPSSLKEPVSWLTLKNSNIGKMLKKPFSRKDDLFADELTDIAQTNAGLNLNPPLEVWITEYNLDETEGKNVGTWAHGLFNAIQTLTYLESPLISHVNSHAMTTNAIYGNLFESEYAFTALTSGQLPNNIFNPALFHTDKFGFTASGAAMNEIALAMKGNNVIAHRIQFSDPLVRKISYWDSEKVPPKWVTSSYPELYGWSFEKDGGCEAIILNLGPNMYRFSDLDQVGRYNNNPVNFESVVILRSSDPTAANGGVVLATAPPPNFDEPLLKSPETSIPTVSSSSPIYFLPYSLTRLIYRDPTVLSIRLTDDEICAGSQTSLLISGMPFGTQCSVRCSSSTVNQLFTLTDSVLVFGSSLPAGTYFISASAGAASSSLYSFVVHDAFSVSAAIISAPVSPCNSPNIQLKATTTPPPPTGSNYTYLWVPDKNIIGQDPYNQIITLNSAKLTTDAYQVFAYNGECWASSNLIVFDRGPLSVNLGNDFTVCSTNSVSLKAMTTSSPSLTNGASYLYQLKDGNGSIIAGPQTSPEFSITSGLTPGNHTFRVEVWAAGINQNCPVLDEVVVNVVNCCNCSSGIVLNPHQYPSSPAANEPVFNISHEKDLLDIVKSQSGYTVNYLSNTYTIQASSTAAPICINGDFWIRRVNTSGSNWNKIVLENCTLRMGPNARIFIKSGATLTLNGCHIEACSANMWDGIYVDPADQFYDIPSLEISSTTSSGTVISNALNAVVARRSSHFNIQNCDFIDNYIDLKIEKYNEQGMDQSLTTIQSCTFTQNTTLLSPHGADNKLAAIWLDDIENRTIGVSGNAGNDLEISNSSYGIYAHDASFTLLNTEFRGILNGSVFRNFGDCIHSISNYNFCNRTIRIGNETAGGANRFFNSTNGILGIGEMNYYIAQNSFGSTFTADRILNNCIRIVNNSKKDIEINSTNEFYDYNKAITIINPLGRLFIDHNNFYNAVTPLTAGTFIGTAIDVVGFSNQSLSDAVISFNRIGGISISGLDQARIGIHLSMLDHLKVLNNEITFNLQSTSDPYRGIWASNCNDLKLDQNEVLNTATLNTVTNDLLTGIRIEESMNSCIENTTLDNMGFGMRFEGNAVVQSFFNNHFTTFDEGIHLEAANIGSTVGTEAPPNSGNGNVMGNEWYPCTGCSLNTKIAGSISSVVLTWYTDVTSGARFPDNNNIVGLIPFPLTGTTQQSECQLPVSIEDETDYGSTMTLRKRNETYGSVVADTARYMEEYAQEFRYLAREAVFKTLRNHPGLMVRDDESDTSFVNFYNTMLGTNTYLIDSLQALINNRQFVEADTLLASFTDENEQEYNYKKVYAATVLLMVHGEEAIDDVLREELTVIAHQHPLLGGYAVYVARNLLQLEIYDELPSNLRVMAQKETKSQRMMNVYPNPANGYVEVSFSDRSIPEQVILRDPTGRICLSMLNSSIVNTATLLPGIYFIEVMVKGEKHNANIVVAR